MKELTLFEPQQLGEVFKQNEGLSQRAVQSIEAKLNALPTDLKTLSVVAGDQVEKEVNDLIIKGNDSVKIAKERRMVYTRKFDEIKTAFTTHEKNIEGAVAGLKDFQNAWNTEKYNRQETERKEQDRKNAIENAKINLKQYVSVELGKEVLQMTNKMIERLVAKFYSLEANALPSWIEEIKTFQPKILIGADILVSIPQVPQLDTQTHNEIVSEVLKNSIGGFNDLYRSKIVFERDKIVELTPSRLAELERMANDKEEAQKVAERIAKENEERKAKEEQERAENEAQAQSEANAQKMDLAFENASVDVATQLSKGASVKLKYNPQTHQHILQLIQWFVINKMNLLTLDEALKKFSFVLTATNEALGKGETIDGVPTIEDVRTRINRK